MCAALEGGRLFLHDMRQRPAAYLWKTGGEEGECTLAGGCAVTLNELPGMWTQSAAALTHNVHSWLSCDYACADYWFQGTPRYGKVTVSNFLSHGSCGVSVFYVWSEIKWKDN